MAFSSGPAALALEQRTQRLLRIREARTALTSSGDNRWISAMLVLAAVEAGSRTLNDISSRTHLEIAQISELVTLGKTARWLTEATRLTRLGRRELARLRRRRKKTPILPNGRNTFYYPTQLRAP
jgi:hypothetical protein